MAARDTHRSSYLGAIDCSRRGVLMGSAAWAALAALGAGCASKPVVTLVSLTLVGAPDINPDARGRASPLATRAYALKAAGSFESGDFFQLFEKDTAILGADLVKREETLLTPGASQRYEWTLAPEVTSIGLMGAYRDLSRAQWRQVIAVQPGQPLNLTATFGARGIVVQRR